MERAFCVLQARVPCADSTAFYPTRAALRSNPRMHPVLQSCCLFLATLRMLIDSVRGLGLSGGARPAFASQAVARRLAVGLRIVEAYLRRVLIVMALELEAELVDAPKPMRRPHGRKKVAGLPGFTVLAGRGKPLSEVALDAMTLGVKRQQRLRTAPAPVGLGRLYQRLDQLAAIAADPMARARRLAFDLARRLPGPILAPDPRLRPPQNWGLEVSTTFDAMAFDILARSRSRPPPLPPIRKYGPSVLLLDGSR